MNAKTLYPYKPDYCSHPGETLAETLEELDLSERGLASLMDVDPTVIHNIVDGKAPITRKLAKKLELAINISADFWIAMQENYDRFQRNRLTKSLQFD